MDGSCLLAASTRPIFTWKPALRYVKVASTSFSTSSGTKDGPRMLRSLSSIVVLSVVVIIGGIMGLWHIYTAHHATFVTELYEVDLGAVDVNVKDKLVNESQVILKHALDSIPLLEHKTRDTTEKKLESLEQENAKLRSQVVRHIAESPTQWRTLKDWTKVTIRGFMSEIQSRSNESGPPELFEFPSALSNGQHLCFRGNDTHNGSLNAYTFAWEEALPSGYILLNGTTLITETQYDFNSPWHSMFNLLQFVYWKVENGCIKAARLILFHRSEFRRTMGEWITQVFTAAGLPVEPEAMAEGDRPICFQKAIVSRLGMGSVPTEIFREVCAQVRCQCRTLCKLPTTRTVIVNEKLHESINITLMVRSGTRPWKNQQAWESVIADQCARVEGCRWSTMHLANLTFCEQIKIMMETDILVSVHGAQLTNMIFMSPGGRIMEMFPKGWLELAGAGQYIYRNLALWNGLVHEGYWRDNDQPDCPSPNDPRRCMSFYKDQSVGINETFISGWLGSVLDDFKSSTLAEGSDVAGDHRSCACQ